MKRKERRDKRREKVIILYNLGMYQTKIAKELGFDESTICVDIKYLKEQGLIENKKTVQVNEEVQKRREIVKELYGKKTQERIAEELYVSKGTIARDIDYLRKQGEIKQPKRKYVKKSTKRQLTDIEKSNKYISDYKKAFEQGELKEDELENIRTAVHSTGKYDDIVFYLQICLKYRRMEDAISFANIQLTNEALNIKEREHINELLVKIKETNQKMIAIRLLKERKSIQEVSEITGISLQEAINLKQKITRKKDTNDDDEEQSK